MLIRLYGLPSAAVSVGHPDVTVRRPLAPEHDVVLDWVAEHFTPGWRSEAQVALGNRPTSLVIAIRGESIIGFCCHDALARGFVGPIGVHETARGSGIGAALLLTCLHEMRRNGYGYAVAGAVGAPEFFARVAGATAIEGSSPGLYAGMLKG
jgi:ribosomal protein S18 acetylase RimI-like enzyme